jgi:hypothetical protein
MELDPFNYSDFSSDESTDFDSPEKPSFVSRFICRGYRRNQVRFRIYTAYIYFASSKTISPSTLLDTRSC